jgi:PAS domain S-box-containing protein
LAVLFPIVDLAVRKIVRIALSNQVEKYVSLLKKASSEEEMIRMIQTDRLFINLPVSLFDGEGNLLIHSSSSIIPEKEASNELSRAIARGKGYAEAATSVKNERYAFIAIRFKMGGKSYIFDTHVIFYEIGRSTLVKFEIILTLLLGAMFAIYVFINQMILYGVTRPIEQIINAIVPYREGKVQYPPRISLRAIKDDAFNKLAFTLNSLTEQIHQQIDNLMREKQKTEEILQSLGEGVIATDMGGRVIFINQSACKMLGVSRVAILGHSLTNDSDLARKCEALILETIKKKESLVEIFSIRKSDTLTLELTAAPLAQDGGALLVIQDKTSDYKVVEMGKDFIANASHELRTPITIIRGFAETLQDLPSISKQMLADITEKIVRTCIRLDKLVKSLLTLADIENLPQNRMQQTDLVLLAENCQGTLLTTCPGTEIAFHTDLKKASIHAEADLIELAILNVLENAVKYSEAPAHIEMRLKKKGHAFLLEISDRGIGISEGDLSHIFERFYTVNKARSRKLGGAGLGLSIVKTIVEKHHGTVSVISEFGKGTTFFLTFPESTG